MYKTHWDTCSTNHHYVHNQGVCVQNDMYNSIPHQTMLVYTCLLFICSALSLTRLILGSGEQSFYYKMSQQFCTRLWFQTSLPLAALPLPCVIITCCFRVAALSCHAPLALSPSGIAPELNRICLRSVVVGKAGRLSIYWQDAACRLVIPLRQVALAQLYKYHHQSGNAASGKLV